MRDRTIHRLFKAGVVLKGVDGALEILGGVVFLLTDPRTLGRIVLFLTAHEISEDPSDVIANILRNGVRHLSPDTTIFASAYLLGHGLVKLAVVAGLLRGRRWAYPTALWFLGAFVVYESYRLLLGHSASLLALVVLDLAVMFVIWREFRSRSGV
jgi:uncharacterized membrane protein